MMNFEKIDDFLANRMTAEERKAFEQEISGDPALQEEVAFQQKIVSTVRKARAAELKQMLQNMPVSAGGWSSGKIAMGVITAGIVATSVYFYLKSNDPVITPNQEAPAVVTPPAQTPEQASVPEAKTETSSATEESGKRATPPKTKVVSPVQKPDIQVVDPSADLAETPSQDDLAFSATTTMTVSKMEVVTAPANKKYTFHYQFSDGKLLLYGPFDNNLYEILEINGGSHAVFLFYKENYYLLDEAEDEVTPLAPIRDSILLQKLKEYRSR